jgi:hypothetical protein
MSQALDMDARISQLGPAHASGAPASKTRAEVSKFGTFAITFGVAFIILYTLFERQNWPLFTYHPAVGKVDFGMQPARSGEGPPMYWYGWVLLAAISATVLGWLATFVSSQRLQRATAFCCVLAVLWPTSFALAGYIADRASFDADFLKSVWLSAIPALVGAAAVSYFVSSQWAQRAWTSWLLIMPIGGLVILGYSLNSYFLR